MRRDPTSRSTVHPSPYRYPQEAALIRQQAHLGSVDRSRLHPLEQRAVRFPPKSHLEPVGDEWRHLLMTWLAWDQQIRRPPVPVMGGGHHLLRQTTAPVPWRLDPQTEASFHPLETAANFPRRRLMQGMLLLRLLPLQPNRRLAHQWMPSGRPQHRQARAIQAVLMFQHHQRSPAVNSPRSLPCSWLVALDRPTPE